jgi:adenylate cyclase
MPLKYRGEMPTAEIIVRFKQEEQKHQLSPDVPCGIGRSPQNAICVPSDTVSRNHALIQQNESGDFCIFDLGSRNGTLLNDRLVTAPMVLHNGDVIQVGEVAISFVQGSSGARAAQLPPVVDVSTVVTFALVQLTVLVVDIRGFTTLSRRIGAERIAELVRAYNCEAGIILDRSAAWTTKFIGDAVMAVWIRKNEEPPAKTLVTAFEVFEKIYRFVSGFQSQFSLEEPVTIGGGINTGYATVGNIGSGSNADYTALGDSVNMAFRLESATRGLECDLTFGPAVQAILRNALDPAVSVGRRNNVCLKGYADECEVYSMQIDDVRQLLRKLRPQ